jgi:glycosyltransferase involved in cell wall biosynthesis
VSGAPQRPRVVLVRGHQSNSWHLRPWRHLSDDYDVVSLETASNWFDTESIGFASERALALRDLLPRGPLGHALARLPGDRYLRPARHLRGADIVHSQDLGFWYSMQAARLKPRLGYKLVLTVWETIPFRDAYRNIRTRPYRRLVLERTDLFLAATERARASLLLEGAPAARIRVCAPGVADELFTSAEPEAQPPREHLLLSVGRLVWEKGHQDLLRAVAALRADADTAERLPPLRVLIVGDGPERARLLRYARELGIADAVEVRAGVPYAEIGPIYARASCLVLGSLPVWSWEEQFGMVAVEAMFAGLEVLASSSGALPEVTRGAATLFAPGDWVGLAKALARGPLARAPGARVEHDPLVLEHYSARAAAARLAAAYDEVLGRGAFAPA